MCPSNPTSTHRETPYEIEIFSSLKKRRKKLQPRTDFLTLRKVAARALSAPTAAGAGERNWSTYSFIVNINRNFLKLERVDATPPGGQTVTPWRLQLALIVPSLEFSRRFF